jgi:outer membrane protein assembly factor BamB
LHRLAVILVLVPVAAAPAADWPHVRGPGYGAHSPETGIAADWSAAGPPVLWTRELGAGYSAFVVAEGRAFTALQTSTGMFLIALDADTGAELWKERIDWPWQPGGMYPGPYASPTWSGGKIYYATPIGTVGCVNAADGRPHWSVKVHERFGGRRGTEFGYASTPTVEDGRVFLPVGAPNAAMVALSAEDGHTLWASGDEPASYCPAYPVTFDGRRCVVGFFQNGLVLFDAATGERLWRERLSASYDEHSAWPLSDGRDLLIAAPFGVGAELYRITAGEGGVTAKTLWSSRQFSNDVCSSLLHDGAVYGFDIQQAQASVHRPARGIFKCLDFATGKVRWETDRIGQASVVYADGKLVVWTETGTLVLVRPSADRYEELARVQVLRGGGMCWAPPALADKRLIVRDHRRAVCLYLGPPSELDPGRTTLTFLGADGGFDWTRLVPKEPEFPNDAPTPREVAIWFAGSTGIFALAAAISLACLRLLPRRYGVTTFALLAFVLGAVGTTAIGTWFDAFVLTWPVSLYVAFRGTIALGLDRTARGWRHQVLARLALVLFVALCYGYYRLCTAVGYAMAWGFLGGFVPALPVAVIASRAGNPKTRWLLDVIGFAVYFLTSASIPGWKARLGG